MYRLIYIYIMNLEKNNFNTIKHIFEKINLFLNYWKFPNKKIENDIILSFKRIKKISYMTINKKNKIEVINDITYEDACKIILKYINLNHEQLIQKEKITLVKLETISKILDLINNKNITENDSILLLNDILD